MSVTGLLAVYVLLQPLTPTYYTQGLLTHHVPVMAEHLPAHGIPVSVYGSTLPN